MEIAVSKNTIKSRNVEKTTDNTYCSTIQRQNQTTKISQYQKTKAARDTTKDTRDLITKHMLEQTTQDASYTTTRDDTSPLATGVL